MDREQQQQQQQPSIEEQHSLFEFIRSIVDFKNNHQLKENTQNYNKAWYELKDYHCGHFYKHKQQLITLKSEALDKYKHLLLPEISGYYNNQYKIQYNENFSILFKPYHTDIDFIYELKDINLFIKDIELVTLLLSATYTSEQITTIIEYIRNTYEIYFNEIKHFYENGNNGYVMSYFKLCSSFESISPDGGGSNYLNIHYYNNLPFIDNNHQVKPIHFNYYEEFINKVTL
jgi:hypothetical protein